MQRPHPPLYFAAYTDRGLRRIARYGDGWLPAGLPLPTVEAMWRGLRELTEAEGRDPDTLRLIVRANATLTDRTGGRPFVGTVDDVADELVVCADVGAYELHLDLHFTPGITTARQYVDPVAAIMTAVDNRLDIAAA